MLLVLLNIQYLKRRRFNVIRDRESEIKNEALRIAETEQLNASGYSYEIQRYAEYNYSKHKEEGWLHYLNFDGSNYSYRSKEQAYLFSYSEDKMNRFAREFKNRLQELGFKNVVVKYEWVVEKKVKNDYAIFRVPTKTGREGYAVYFYVEW